MEVGVGSAIPNAQTKQADRGLAKIANVDPTVLAQFGTWERMRREAAGLFAAKGDRIVRNYIDSSRLQIQLYQDLQDNARLEDAWRAFVQSHGLRSSTDKGLTLH